MSLKSIRFCPAILRCFRRLLPLVSFVVEDSVEDSEAEEDDCEGGLNWRGAFKGGIVSGVTHVLKCTASETIMLLAFNILFNMIERPQV